MVWNSELISNLHSPWWSPILMYMWDTRTTVQNCLYQVSYPVQPVYRRVQYQSYFLPLILCHNVSSKYGQIQPNYFLSSFCIHWLCESRSSKIVLKLFFKSLNRTSMMSNLDVNKRQLASCSEACVPSLWSSWISFL